MSSCFELGASAGRVGSEVYHKPCDVDAIRRCVCGDVPEAHCDTHADAAAQPPHRAAFAAAFWGWSLATLEMHRGGDSKPKSRREWLLAGRVYGMNRKMDQTKK